MIILVLIELTFLLVASTQLHYSVQPQCKNVSIVERSDCYPEKFASSEKCISRGCCWVLASSPYENMPACYFPKYYPSYEVESVKQTTRGFIAKLIKHHLNYNNHTEIRIIEAEIRYETESRMRLRITIPSQPDRWEPPIPLDEPDQIPIKNPQYHVDMVKSPFGLKISRSNNPDDILLDSTDIMAPNLIVSDQFLQMSFRLNATHGFGIGESENSFPLTLNKWIVSAFWAHDNVPGPNANLYGVHNFFVGLNRDGQAFGLFLLNSNAQEVVLSPLPSITHRTIGGILDYFLFTGPSPADVIRQYYELIGKPPVPPYWSLGFHLCRYGIKTLNETWKIMKRNLEANIPIDAQWYDIDYMDAYKIWTVDKVNYNGIGDYAEKLHNLYGLKNVIIIDPAISTKGGPNYAPYLEGLNFGIFINDSRTGKPILGLVWPGETVFPDFGHPAAASWWLTSAKQFYAQHVKFDGLWIDMNEPANFVAGSFDGCQKDNKLDNPIYVPNILGNTLYDKTICPSSLHYNNLTHYNKHNLYGYEESRVTSYVLKTLFPKKRPFLLSRSTFAGSGRYTYHWTGDVSSTWQSLRTSIAQLINFNIFAIPMVGTDICGFGGDVSEELCVRWSQLGAFYPFSRNHNDDKSRDQDPAVWSPYATKAIRDALIMKYQFLPYFYTLFYRSYLNGTTVARALAFEYPFDTNTHNISSQFMIGSCLLVIPALYEGQVTVKAYVPAGEWIDLTSGLRLSSSGEQMYFDAPLNVIPVLARTGYVIPMQLKFNATSISRKKGFGITVILSSTDHGYGNFSSSQAYGELFWDDGDNDEDKFVHIEFKVLNRKIKIYSNQKSKDIARAYLDVKELQLKFVLIVGLDKCPQKVLINQISNKFKFFPKSQTVVMDLEREYFLINDTLVEWSF